MIFLLLLKIIYRLNNPHPQFYDMLFYEDKLDCMLYNNNYTFLSFLVTSLINPTPHML